MTIEEASTVKKGDMIIYISDDWNDNIIYTPVIVTNILENNGNVTHFDVKPVNKKQAKIESAFAPISCFKFI